MKSPRVNIYQLFQREFGEKGDNFLELVFTYLLKCFYFPKYLRPEYWQEQDKEEEINRYLQHYNAYCYNGILSKEFIKGVIEFMPNQKNLNKISDEEVEQLIKAWEIIPKEWKEKRPWYPLSYCDLALDDCLIEIKWTEQEEIKEEYISKLVHCLFDYDFPTIKKIGIYFAKQGKLLVCDKWGCPDNITPQDFHQETVYSKRKPTNGKRISLESK